MKENQVIVESCADCTIVVDVPEDRIHKEWTARGQKYPFDKDQLDTLMYRRDVSTLFQEGYLKCMDREFLENNNLLEEDGTPKVVDLTPALMKRMIGVMPINEFKESLKKLSKSQLADLADFAIDHPNELKLDKADILTKMTGKNILRTIEFAKDDQEA